MFQKTVWVAVLSIHHTVLQEGSEDVLICNLRYGVYDWGTKWDTHAGHVC